jgi:RNA polymerase sigma-70 factor, ECF subfamily
MYMAADRPEELYREAVGQFGPALCRLASATEFEVEKRRDLLQDIHVELWRSFARFDQRCSLSTWVFRVAHNVAADHVVRARRRREGHSVSLEDLEAIADDRDHHGAVDQQLALATLYRLIGRLRPLDRQVMLLYLEDRDADSIAQITGLAAGNVATRIHRIKLILVREFQRRTP